MNKIIFWPIFVFCLVISACKTNKELVNEEPLKDEVSLSSEPKIEKVAIDRVIITLEPDISIDEILAEFKHIDLKKSGRVQKTQNKWLCVYNKYKANDKYLLKSLNEHDFIIKAEKGTTPKMKPNSSDDNYINGAAIKD